MATITDGILRRFIKGVRASQAATGQTVPAQKPEPEPGTPADSAATSETLVDPAVATDDALPDEYEPDFTWGIVASNPRGDEADTDEHR